MKKLIPFILKVVMFPLLLSILFLAVYSEGIGNQLFSNNLTTNFVLLTYSRLQEREEHIYLSPLASVTFNATEISDGWKFKRMNVQMDAANRSFLKEIVTDLYVTTYDFWGGNVGAWTSNDNFTLTNPSGEMQELMLKISNAYSRRAYATDIVNGTSHSITFTTDVAADQVAVNWGFFGVLESLAINGSQVDPTLVSSTNRLMMEDISYGTIFYSQMSNTSFVFKLEEKGLLPPPESPYIGAWVSQHNVITLNPHQEILFEVPDLKGWTYSYGSIDSNITLSLYSQPYPFKLVNLTPWNPEEAPVLATLMNTTFGIRNLSDKTYCVNFNPTLYYWQNQTGIRYSHQINTTENSIYHKLSVYVSNAKAGAELGLRGQFLAFRSVPSTALGRVGKTLSYEAPDPVGRWEESYIPLREGNYTLATVEPKIVANITTSVDDFHLTATLNLNITYDGDPCANANITVHKKGTFTSTTYNTSTDKDGKANITIRANGPEVDELDINVTKDAYNHVTQVITFTIGTLWVLAAVSIVAITALAAAFLLTRKRHTSKEV